MIFFYIIVAILMFSFIIILHEFGHFLAARLFGIKVKEFGLGIPPQAKKIFTDSRGTQYTLNWLPLGGFVRLKGEGNVGNRDKDSLKNTHYLAHSIILLGGVFMNFLLAIVIFSSLFYTGVKPLGINSQIATHLDIKLFPNREQAVSSGFFIQGTGGILLSPQKGSVAQKAGILHGDRLLQAHYSSPPSGKHVDDGDMHTTQELAHFISSNENTELIFTILRDGKTLTLPITPLPVLIPQNINTQSPPLYKGFIGSALSDNSHYNNEFQYKYGFIDSVKYGVLETYNHSILTVKALGILFQKIVNPQTPTERQEAVSNMKGPIGIIDLVVHLFKEGMSLIFILGALISISLGIFNLLPIPALDGGRFLFLSINTLIKKITGKKDINQGLENIIHIFFFVILILLSIFVGYNDVVTIFNR